MRSSRHCRRTMRAAGSAGPRPIDHACRARTAACAAKTDSRLHRHCIRHSESTWDPCQGAASRAAGARARVRPCPPAVQRQRPGSRAPALLWRHETWLLRRRPGLYAALPPSVVPSTKMWVCRAGCGAVQASGAVRVQPTPRRGHPMHSAIPAAARVQTCQRHCRPSRRGYLPVWRSGRGYARARASCGPLKQEA